MLAAIGLCAEQLVAQDTKKADPLFINPLGYVVKYTADKLTIDGKPDEKAWQAAPWTTDFVDIEGELKPRPAFGTKVKMLWNDDYLFIVAQMQEPQVWAKQQHHDDVIFRDNDIEVFINPDNTTHRYFELEFNALNKVFDLFLNKPYRNGGDALIGWNADGLQSAVSIDGTLNNFDDKDKSWTVEMAIPLKSLWIGYPFHGPQEGTLWRINFSRVEWDTKVLKGNIEKVKGADGRDMPEHNWVWSPQGVVNMHYPERWGYLQFTRGAISQFSLPYTEKQKSALWDLYYRQKEYLQKNGHYGLALADLGMQGNVQVGDQANQITMEASARQFRATININNQPGISINDEGLIQYLKK